MLLHTKADTRETKMIGKLSTVGTLGLLRAMTDLARSDIKRYGIRNNFGDYVGKKTYESAKTYLEEDYPVIQEILQITFREM